MFDVGFMELAFVALIALLVLGPERLPSAIRTVSVMIAQMRRSFNTIKTQVEEELKIDEIKQTIHNEGVLQAIKDAESNIESNVQKLHQGLSNLHYDVSDIVNVNNDSDDKENFDDDEDTVEQESPPLANEEHTPENQDHKTHDG